MLLCLCGPPSISLSFSLAAVLPRRHTYRVRWGTGPVNGPHPECAPFRVGTTRVSNPVCSPDFRASASVAFQEGAFASGVLQDINAFHRYTLHSPSLSRTPADQFRTHFPGWARRFHTRHASQPTCPLRPVNPNNACDLCITAAAGTELAVASSWGTVN